MFIRSMGFVRHDIGTFLLCCFSAATLAAAPQLRLSTSAVGPLFVEVGSNSPAQTINTFNIGSGSLNLSITSSASWLSGSLGATTTCTGGPVAACTPLNIAVSSAGLAIGTYTESLTLTDPNAIDSPQSVTVTVQVNGTPTGVNLYVTPSGGPSPTASVTVNTGGSVKSAVRTSDNGPWLAFALSGGGSYQFYTSYQLQVTAQPSQSGNYSGTVALSGSTYGLDNQAINVNLQVTTQPILQTSQLTYNLIQGQAAQTVSVGQNIGMGTLAVSGATVSGGNWISAAASGGPAASLTLNPQSLTPGSYIGSLTLASNAANTSVPIPIRLNVAAAGNPLIYYGGVVDNAAFAAGMAVASGTIAVVFGSQFSATGPTNASGLPLPTTLAGLQVLVNGTPVPLFYVDANQADFQVPFGLSAGQMIVQVIRNGLGGNQVSASVAPIAPRLFTTSYRDVTTTSLYGIVINSSDGTLALPTTFGIPAHPANRGDVVTIYALGLGPVSPSVATGAPGPATAPLAQTVNPVTVTFGGGFLGEASATPQYAGLAPNYVGLYQINVQIPADSPIGNVPVLVGIPGHASNFVEMAIGH